MTKKELADKVRAAARNVASRADKPENATPMALKYSDMLFKFPKLQEILANLMSDEFTIFVENIEWVAPRPTTFKVILKNQNYFHLIWNVDNFIARVSGTNYNLSSIGDNERAIKAIQELLITGPINPDKGSATASQELNPADEVPEETPVETPAEA
jgi:hypothetical protein